VVAEQALSETRSADGLFALPQIDAQQRPDGSWLVRSLTPLAPYPVSILASLRAWAAASPDHPLVAERDPAGGWRSRSYGEAAAAARSVGQALLGLGLGPDRPLLILSGNSADHLVISLGAMTAGIPVAPVSTAYSLQSRDHDRIRRVAAMIRPGAVYAEDAGQFAAALAALDAPWPGARGSRDQKQVTIITSRGEGPRPGRLRLADLVATAPGPEADAAYAALSAASLAKILLTSGSTGEPKGVLTTHGMLAANQQMLRQGWPFLADERPVITDWLPWSHTFGGSHNVNLAITNGGTIHVDDGRPAPALFGRSLATLADVPPTVYFNVPAGYAQLAPALEADPELARRFFSRLRLMMNAAAALPPSLRRRMEDLAVRAAGRPVPLTAAWGLSETAPAVTFAHFEFEDPACIGVPLPGTEVKLAPDGDAYELRVRGPNVTPGYLRRPDLTDRSFDAEGFYRTGDAADLIDPQRPELGLSFRGRIAEDFKLTTGTFVRVGAVRTALLSAVPLLADAVLTGEGRDYVAALAWLNPAEARRQLGREPAAAGEIVTDPEVLRRLAAALAAQPAGAGSAGRVERLLVLSRPADLDAGEITDKGYVNQRRVLRNRAELAGRLYAEPGSPGLVTRL
jgi:feruloyl-CoA synthase